MVRPTPVREKIIEFRNNASIVNINKMKRWLEELDSDEEWNEFMDLNGPGEIIDILSKEEVKSRDTK